MKFDTELYHSLENNLGDYLCSIVVHSSPSDCIENALRYIDSHCSEYENPSEFRAYSYHLINYAYGFLGSYFNDYFSDHCLDSDDLLKQYSSMVSISTK